MSATPPYPMRLWIGLDLGKIQDYTALAIVEELPATVRIDERAFRAIPAWSDDPHWHVRHLQRWELLTPYETIAHDLDGLLLALLNGRPRPDLNVWVDATGVGVAVVERLRAQPILRSLGVNSCSITAGKGWSQAGPGEFHVAKSELVGVAQVAIQRGRIRVAKHLPDAAVLLGELRGFEARISDSGNMQFSHREGEHDDLVLAVALACWGGAGRRAGEVVQTNYLGLGAERDTPPYGPAAARRRRAW
ncbi:MAG TPA: hypothetical protein VFL91_03185 [Thermomicrobiales bacterium]|nr:hypothetical protein [Thermomicrobiales bacterium]